MHSATTVPPIFLPSALGRIGAYGFSYSPLPIVHDRAWQVKLPLDPGTRVDCRWRDGQMYPARVIERRAAPNGIDHEYYMHYIKCAPACSSCVYPSSGAVLRRTIGSDPRPLLWLETCSGPIPWACPHHTSCKARLPERRVMLTLPARTLLLSSLQHCVAASRVPEFLRPGLLWESGH